MPAPAGRVGGPNEPTRHVAGKRQFLIERMHCQWERTVGPARQSSSRKALPNGPRRNLQLLTKLQPKSRAAYTTKNDASQYFSHDFRRRNLVNRHPSNCARPTSNKRISRIEVKSEFDIRGAAPIESDAGASRGFGKLRLTNRGQGQLSLWIKRTW
jgi:hypothetical protein